MAKTDRNGKRRPRKAFQTRVPDLGYYFIVTDTRQTEANYLYGLRDALPPKLQGRIVIKVSKAKTQQLVKTCKEQAALEPQYGQPWIVFDRDRVVNFDAILAQAEREGVHAGWSNPCIEIWFEAYFGKMGPYSDSVTCCRRFAETFAHRTGQEYRKDDPQIYTMLGRFGDEAKAIQIAAARLQGYLQAGVNKPSAMCPCTTVYQLVSEIQEKTAALDGDGT